MHVALTDHDIRPIVAAAVEELLSRRQAAEVALDLERLAYPEAEAAAAMGVPQYVLRDCRLRGELQGRRVGKRVLYSRDELLRFLAARPAEGSAAR